MQIKLFSSRSGSGCPPKNLLRICNECYNQIMEARGHIWTWVYLNIIFFETNLKFPSLQVVTICSWRNCVCCFQDVANPISICQQSYFTYVLYHRRKPLNSKYAINSKTQACFLFRYQRINSQELCLLDFSSQYLFRLVNFTQFHSISISSLCGHLQHPHWIFKIIFFISKIKSQEYHRDKEYLMNIGHICLAVNSKSI